MGKSAGKRHLILFVFSILLFLLLPYHTVAKGTPIVQEITLKPSPNGSVIVVKMSSPPVYKVIRIAKNELMVAFKNSHFLDTSLFKGIRDELVYEIQPTWKSNGVICINIALDPHVTNIEHRFDSKNINLIIELKKKIDLENPKNVSAKESIETSRESVASQNALNHIQEETIKNTYVPAERIFWSRLLTITDNDGGSDTALFLDAIKACKNNHLEEGLKTIWEFIRQYPKSRLIEETLFLLAECYRRLHADNLSEHFKEIIENYQNAIQKSPNSAHTTLATLILANTYFKMKKYYEALAYYNLLWSQHRDNDAVASEAQFQIGKIHLLINKPAEAIAAFQSVVKLYPQTFFAKKSRMEIAKGFFEMNRFKKSLSIWTDIAATNPVSVYKYPDILMYIGNNYYQLGQYKAARDTLLRGINLHPDSESSHLTLARIADAYYEMDQKQSAYKFYNLVIKEYPGSDGTLISSIRLASRYKKTDNEKIVLIPPVGLDSTHYSLYSNPQELYEDIIKKYSDNPMSKFVMLKLALLQQKDGEYEASINTIRNILQKYPPTAVERDILRDSYKAFFKQELDKENYTAILSHYEHDKDILEKSDSPEIFLMVGETCRALGLHHSASLMFQIADKFFLKENRPPRLLFGLGESFFRMNDLKNAYSLFINLLQKDATYKDIPVAYYRIGQILLKEKKYDEAKKNLKIALCSKHKEVPKADVSLEIAEALKGMRQYEEAITWTKDAVALLEERRSFEALYDAYIRLGDLYGKIGRDGNAAGILESALRLKGQDGVTKQQGVLFRLAQCYQRLNRLEEALELLRKISVHQDTLWGNIAAEKIKEIDIRQKIMKINKLKS